MEARKEIGDIDISTSGDIVSSSIGRDPHGVTVINKNASSPDAPVMQLPPEILSEIFLLNVCRPLTVRHMWPRRITGITSPRARAMNASQVCRYWREIAFQSPRLWAFIINYKRDTLHWTKELLRRSQSAIFNVAIDLNDKNSDLEEAVDLAFQEMSRIARFHVKGLVFSPAVNTYLQQPAPHLTSLVLHFTDSEPIPELPENMLSGSKLRRLSLQYCNMNYRSPLLQNLTHLTLCASATCPVAHSIEGWLITLGQMRHLKHLELAGMTHPAGKDPESLELPHVFLPELQQITYIESNALTLMDFAVFLDHLFPHPACRLSLSYLMVSPINLLGGIHNSIQQMISSWPPDTIAPCSIHLDMTDRHIQLEVEDDEEICLLELLFYWQDNESELHRLFSLLISLIKNSAIKGVHQLEVKISDGVPFSLNTPLGDLMHATSEIEVFQIHSNKAAGLLLRLLTGLNWWIGDQPMVHITMLPILLEIEFENVNFGGMTFDLLLSLLKMRSKPDLTSIEVVTMSKCSGKDRKLPILEATATGLDVDVIWKDD